MDKKAILENLRNDIREDTITEIQEDLYELENYITTALEKMKTKTGVYIFYKRDLTDKDKKQINIIDKIPLEKQIIKKVMYLTITKMVKVYNDKKKD